MGTLFLINKNKVATAEEGGMKAINLLKMKEHDFPVPSFRVIPKSSILELMKPVKLKIDTIITSLEEIDLEKQRDKLGQIQKEIREFQLDDKAQDQIKKALEHEFGQNYSVSVRSSACVEDGSKASFAGQFKSYLNCGPDDVIDAIKLCIASYFSFEVYTYRKTQQIFSDFWEFGIIIQKMINSIKSGVAFSVDHTNNMADAVVVAGYGAGEGIVSDVSDSDTYRVERVSKNIHTDIHEKSSMLVHNEKKGLDLRKVDEDHQYSSVLSPEEVLQVFEYSILAEKLLHSPADIEFCFDSTGNIHLLQMRPITFKRKNRLIILDNTNIVESYPGITLPLTFSFALHAYAIVFSSAAKAFLLSSKQIKSLELVFNHLLAHYKGRIYYRMDNWYKLTDLVYKSRDSLESWKNAVGLQDENVENIHFGLGGKIRMSLAMIWMLIRHRSRVKGFFSSFYKNYSKFRAPDALQLPTINLWGHYLEYSELLFEKWNVTIINDFLAFRAFGALRKQLSKLGFSENESLANDLITNFEEVESELAIIKILEIKSEIIEHPELQSLFQLANDEILVVIDAFKYPSLSNKIKTYLDVFGDRNLAELKLETPTLRSNRSLLIDIIKGQLNSRMTLNQYLETKRNNKQAALVSLKEKVFPFSPRYYMIKLLVSWSSRLIKNRENMRFARTRSFGVVKTIFLEIGKRMHEDGLLESPEDLFFLELEWLEKYCLHNEDKQYKAYVREIKAKFKQYKKISLPDRIIYVEGYKPNFDGGQKVYNSDQSFSGLPVSNGSATGEAIVIDRPEFGIDVKNKIIITRMTDPGWVFLMSQASGIICERGSLLSHTAIIGRELGIPVIVGIKNATSKIKTGQIVSMDGSSGRIVLK